MPVWYGHKDKQIGQRNDIQSVKRTIQFVFGKHAQITY